METIEKRQERTDATAIKLPLIQNEQSLAARLKELQRIVVLERISYNEMPPRVDYNLTDRGQ
jgi:DNA-binding HxlR family transcriptional regulator